jgi:hypothetical protein
MPIEQLFQRPAVRTGRFNITDFATYTTQATVIKQNLQTESKINGTYSFVRHYTQYNIHYTHYPYIIHCAHYTIQYRLYTVPHILYTIHCTQYPIYCTQYTVHSTLYTVNYTQFSCLQNTFCCSVPITRFNTNSIMVLLLRMSLYTQLVVVGLMEFRIIQ